VELRRALIGRAAPLKALGDALADPPAIVLLSGEAGIGKTRLVAEIEAGAGLVLHGE
jgi:tRNA A37 threonylcarbamoyladenosine biosynthesis protein TsaE